MTWTELVFPATQDEQPGLVAGVLAPLLADLDRPGLFLRELGPEGATRLLLQVRDAPPDLPTRTAALPVQPTAVRAATVAPLGGPVFDGPGLDETTRGFLADTAPVAVDLSTRPDRTGAALTLMTAHLAAVADPARSGDGPPLSFLSFRSHAEAFLATTRDPNAARHAFDTRYTDHRTTVEAAVRAILLDGDPGDAAPWSAAARAAKPRFTAGFASADLVAHTGYTRDHLRERTDFADNPFHSRAGASEQLQAYLGGDPSFLATRLLTSLLYVTLHSSGVSLMQRYFLCHAIAKACESIYHVDSMSLLADLAVG
uniref:NocO n=1 Tax=Nocardia sp. ATCC 202099 TaxID=930400 RepID=E5DUI6_9NOCA|nr:NocO [Nocardia sp. ATCC 202099]